MSLMNCPECKEKMSDTLKACPHCGFRIKLKKENISKDKKSIKEILGAIINWIKNNKKKSIIIGCIVVALIIVIYSIMYYISLEPKRMAERGVEYLEDKGYKCSLEDGYKYRDNLGYDNEVYVCRLEEDGHEIDVVLYYSPKSSMFYRINYPLYALNVKYIYKVKGYDFYISDVHFDSSITISMKKDGNGICSYNPSNGKENFSKKQAKVNDYCYEGKITDNKRKNCEVCEYYLDEVNAGLKFFDELYDEIVDK